MNRRSRTRDYPIPEPAKAKRERCPRCANYMPRGNNIQRVRALNLVFTEIVGPELSKELLRHLASCDIRVPDIQSVEVCLKDQLIVSAVHRNDTYVGRHRVAKLLAMSHGDMMKRYNRAMGKGAPKARVLDREYGTQFHRRSASGRSNRHGAFWEKKDD